MTHDRRARRRPIDRSYAHFDAQRPQLFLQQDCVALARGARLRRKDFEAQAHAIARTYSLGATHLPPRGIEERACSGRVVANLPQCQRVRNQHTWCRSERHKPERVEDIALHPRPVDGHRECASHPHVAKDGMRNGRGFARVEIVGQQAILNRRCRLESE